MLRIEGLGKRYGDVVALDGVDFAIASGEVRALLGPNGAGKTTLVSTVAGVCRPDTGLVEVGGVDVGAEPQRAGQVVGFAPQDLGVYPVLTVRENLRLFGELAGLRRRALRARVEEAAEALGLERQLDRPVRFLSGGQQRRAHTAMALLARPPLLLLDEPTAGVDVGTRARILRVVEDLAADGAAVCYTTHYLSEVEALAASVTILDHGRVVVAGGVTDLVAAHGGAALELAFDGPAPRPALDRRVEIEGPVLRVFTGEPAADLPAVFAALGPEAARVCSAEVVRPSLESVFLTLTGRRYGPDQRPTEEVAGVVAA